MYPASSESIRNIARKTAGSGTSFVDVRHRLDSSHSAALTEAAGDLHGAMGPMVAPYMANASHAARAAIWAACQLERFADAIDTYNLTSTNPRSISKLNAAYDELDGDPLGRDVRELIQEKHLLEGALDDAAATIASNIGREPTDAEIEHAWKAGNLPVAAIGAWPELKLRLTDLPTGATDPAITRAGLRHLSDERLAEALADPDLNLEVRNAIIESRSGAVAILARNWELTRDTKTRADMLCRPNSNGQIVGPDGRLYNVTIPGDAPESDIPVLGPMNDSIPDDGAGSGWTTVGSKDGDIAYGDEIDIGDKIAFVLAGTAGLGKPIGHWQSIGPEQSTYMTTHDGSVTLNDGTNPPQEPGRPVFGPYPDSMTPPEHNNMYRASNAAFVAIAGLEGLTNAQQAEFNRHYGTEVVFQENDNGELRAIINLNQVQSNGEEIRIQQGYATVDPVTGKIVPYTEPSDE